MYMQYKYVFLWTILILYYIVLDNTIIINSTCQKQPQIDALTYITSDIDHYDLISHGLDLCHASQLVHSYLQKHTYAANVHNIITQQYLFMQPKAIAQKIYFTVLRPILHPLSQSEYV